MTRMLQIGVTALRSPDGEFLKPIPMYVKEDDLAAVGGTIDGLGKIANGVRNNIANGKSAMTGKERTLK